LESNQVLSAGTGFTGMGHAADMAILNAGTNWAAALVELEPDVVPRATPGGAQYPPIKQGIAQALIGGDILDIAGDVRDDPGRAPRVASVHDFTKRCAFIPENLDDPLLEWGESSGEWSYTVTSRQKSDLDPKPVFVLFKCGGSTPWFHDDHIVGYGTKGAIYLEGHYGVAPLSLLDGSGRREHPKPLDIASLAYAELADTEYRWHVLADYCVRDLRGQAVPPDPTFAQGAQHQGITAIHCDAPTWADAPPIHHHERGLKP